MLSKSLAAIAAIPVYHQASAKECNDNSDNGGHDDDSGSSSCSDIQDSDSNEDHNEHSDDDGSSSRVKMDKIPFVLAEPIPFP
jgi:hypothetical protein